MTSQSPTVGLDELQKVCQGCHRLVSVTDSSATCILCDACKKFHSRYRERIAHEPCICHQQADADGERCRFCRFQRCETALAEKRALATAPKAGDDDDVDLSDKVDFSTLPCAVCGFSSSGFHFGAVTCEGCKGFFRRSINKTFKLQYTCKGLKDELSKLLCPASSNCRKCRLQRCHNAGMSFKDISIGRHTLRRRAEIEAAVKKHMEEGTFLESKKCRKNRHVFAIDKDETEPESQCDWNSQTIKPSPIKYCDSEASATCIAALDGILMESSEWFIERAVAASAKLAPISSYKVLLCPDYTEEQIVAARVKSCEFFAKCTSDFVTLLPGSSLISMEDRIVLFGQAYSSLTQAQLALSFDMDLQLPNHMCLDRPSGSVDLCMAKYSWEAVVHEYMVEAGNILASSVRNLKEFALFCALLYLNPEAQSLRHPEIIKILRNRFEIAVLEHFTFCETESSPEEPIARFYKAIPIFRRAHKLLQDIFGDINENQPHHKDSWTPLITEIVDEVVKNKAVPSSSSGSPGNSISPRS